jgi:hypothetical protein
MRRDDHDRPADRRRTSGEARAAAPSDEGPVVAGGDPDGGDHVCGRGREAHGGRFTDVHAGISSVELELERLRPNSIGTQRVPEVGEQRAVLVYGRSLPIGCIRSARRHE